MSDVLALVWRTASRLLGIFTVAALVLTPVYGQTCPSPGYSTDRVIILDASGSMFNIVGRSKLTRMEVARQFVGKLALTLSSKQDAGRLGLVAFGNKKTPASTEPPTCRDVETIVPLAANVLEAIASRAQRVQPKSGPTPADGGRSPLFGAIAAAARELPEKTGGTLILVTDLETNEECFPPSLAAANFDSLSRDKKGKAICQELAIAITDAGRQPGNVRLQFVLGAGPRDKQQEFIDLVSSCNTAEAIPIDTSNMIEAGIHVADALLTCQAVAQPSPAPPPAEARLELKLEWDRIVLDLLPGFEFGVLNAKARYTAGTNELKIWDFPRHQRDQTTIPLKPGTKGKAEIVDASGNTIANSQDYDLGRTDGGQLVFKVKPASVRAEITGLENPAERVVWTFKLASGGKFVRRTNGPVFEGVIPPGEWSVETSLDSNPGPRAHTTFTADFGKEQNIKLAIDSPVRLGKLDIRMAGEADIVIGPAVSGPPKITAVPIAATGFPVTALADPNAPVELNPGQYNVEISTGGVNRKIVTHAVDAVTIGSSADAEIILVSARARLLGHALLGGKDISGGLTWFLQWGSEQPVKFSAQRFDQLVRPGPYKLRVVYESLTEERNVVMDAGGFADIAFELRR